MKRGMKGRGGKGRQAPNEEAPNSHFCLHHWTLLPRGENILTNFGFSVHLCFKDAGAEMEQMDGCIYDTVDRSNGACY